MSIPIENLYYLLSYSWDRLDERQKIKIDLDGHTDLLGLLVKILISATKLLLKSGIEKSYVESIEELKGIKGKLQFSESIKRNSFQRQGAVCSFDEFSANILSNQILFSTLRNLTRTKGVENTQVAEIVSIMNMLPYIDYISLRPFLFSKVQIGRANKLYGIIMDVCELIYGQSLPSQRKGFYIFRDFERDEVRMRVLFESFVRNFYKREQNFYNIVKKERIYWAFSEINPLYKDYLPVMETDISLMNKQTKIIIDTKYYKDNMKGRYGNEKLKSENLYQLFSYLRNQDDGSDRNRTAIGILLYPTIEKEYDLDYTFQGHTIKIRTLNLNSHWISIAKRLKNIINLE